MYMTRISVDEKKISADEKKISVDEKKRTHSHTHLQITDVGAVRASLGGTMAMYTLIQNHAPVAYFLHPRPRLVIEDGLVQEWQLRAKIQPT